MKELDINYKIGLVKNNIIELIVKIHNYRVASCCPNENEIYLYGQEPDFDIWLDTLQHEIMHAVLHMLDVPIKYHHEIMHFF